MSTPKHVHASPWRTYRRGCRPGPGETGFQVVVEQTDLWIVAEHDLRRQASQAVNAWRAVLRAYIARWPEFATSLSPLPDDQQAVPMIQAMLRGTAICGVGPMAAVAGAIAQWVSRDLARTVACDQRSGRARANILVENGGDLYMYSTRERIIGLLTSPENGPGLGLRLTPHDFPCALCSSSATIGHSLSLGQADLVATRSRDAALADAAATALGNMLCSPADMQAVMDHARTLEPYGLDGVFAQCGEQVGVWGKMELVCLE